MMAKKENINLEMALHREVWNKIQKAGTCLSKLSLLPKGNFLKKKDSF